MNLLEVKKKAKILDGETCAFFFLVFQSMGAFASEMQLGYFPNLSMRA
jgi:hypothetical protein